MHGLLKTGHEIGKRLGYLTVARTVDYIIGAVSCRRDTLLFALEISGTTNKGIFEIHFLGEWESASLENWPDYLSSYANYNDRCLVNAVRDATVAV